MQVGSQHLSRIVVAAVLLVSAIGLWPELEITRFDVNDNISHFTMLDGMVKAMEHGESPIDFWGPEITFGYPAFRTYQPLAHLLVAFLYFAFGKTVSLMTLFVWVRFLSVWLLPLTFYKTARLLELPPLTGAAASLLAPLISTVEGGLMGMEYYSYIWLGYGLFAQAVATHFLLLSVGFGFQALRRGRCVSVAGIMLGLASLAHFIYGYIGAVTLCLLAVVPDSATGRWVRLRRTAWIGVVSLSLAFFQLVLLFLDHAIINRSRIEPEVKWNSYGAARILGWLFQGELFDHSRLPVLSALVAAGCAGLLWRYRRQRRLDPPEGFILAGAFFWLLVYFGRPTWGPLLYLLGISPDLHLHRVIAALEIFCILMAALTLSAIWRWLGRRSVAAAAVLTVVLLAPAFLERARVLGENARGREGLPAIEAARKDVEAAISMVSRRGGRVYAGLGSTWGGTFRVGFVPFYAFLSTHHVPAVSFTYSDRALTADIMVRFDEANPDHFRLFNIRSVVMPAGMASQHPYLTERAQIGQFRIFDAPGAGYFDIVDVPAAIPASRDSFYAINRKWMDSDWVHNGQYLLLDFFHQAPSTIPRLSVDAPLPPASAAAQPAGTVRSERQDGQVYQAHVVAARPAWALFRMTWHPNWRVYVDNRPVTTAMLSPGFLGVSLTPGEHRIVCRYQPERALWLLFPAGVAIAILLAIAERRRLLPGI